MALRFVEEAIRSAEHSRARGAARTRRQARSRRRFIRMFHHPARALSSLRRADDAHAEVATAPVRGPLGSQSYGGSDPRSAAPFQGQGSPVSWNAAGATAERV